MQLIFEIVGGDQAGARFEIRQGLSIGRKDSDIILKDPKVSSLHAKIEERGKDSFFLVDAGSVNGLKVGKEKVQEVLLVPGVQVRLGRTTLKVLDGTNLEPAAIAQGGLETWPATIGRLANWAGKKLANEGASEVAAFNPLIQLKFIQGRQAGTVWTLGYGPRRVGTEALDLRIEEPDSPAVCFELQAHREGPQFVSEHPDKVKLNGKEIRQSRIGSGDVIEIGKTKIEIVFKYDE